MNSRYSNNHRDPRFQRRRKDATAHPLSTKYLLLHEFPNQEFPLTLFGFPLTLVSEPLTTQPGNAQSISLKPKAQSSLIHSKFMLPYFCGHPQLAKFQQLSKETMKIGHIEILTPGYLTLMITQLDFFHSMKVKTERSRSVSAMLWMTTKRRKNQLFSFYDEETKKKDMKSIS